MSNPTDGEVCETHRRDAPVGPLLAVGTRVAGAVACHHVFGLGIRLDADRGFAHVHLPEIADGPISGIEDYPPIGSRVVGVVLGHNGSRLRVSLRSERDEAPEALRYDEPPPIAREDAEDAFASDDVPRICEALVGVALHEPDWRWAQDRALELLEHDDAWVRGLAATCLGHVARIHGMLDEDTVIPALHAASDRDSGIAGRVDDALGDITQFTRMRPRRAR